MQNKGTITCNNCDKEIKWVKIIRNKATAPIYIVTEIENDEAIVNNDGEVHCKNCNEINKIH